MERKSETRTLQQTKQENRSLAEKVFLFLVGLWVLQLLYYYPLMPGSMASHFNAAGKANGWMAKEGFFLLSLGTLVFFVAVFLILPRFLRHVPDALINLPNKSHWLAPERRASTFGAIRGRIMQVGSATALFMLVLFQLVLHANLSGGNRLPAEVMWGLTAVYVAFCLVWTVLFIRSFRMPKTRG